LADTSAEMPPIDERKALPVRVGNEVNLLKSVGQTGTRKLLRSAVR